MGHIHRYGVDLEAAMLFYHGLLGYDDIGLTGCFRMAVVPVDETPEGLLVRNPSQNAVVLTDPFPEREDGHTVPGLLRGDNHEQMSSVRLFDL